MVSLPEINNTHNFFSEGDKESRPVTLVTQVSLDRIDLLESSLEHWQGPVSVALYVPTKASKSENDDHGWKRWDGSNCFGCRGHGKTLHKTRRKTGTGQVKSRRAANAQRMLCFSSFEKLAT